MKTNRIQLESPILLIHCSQAARQRKTKQKSCSISCNCSNVIVTHSRNHNAHTHCQLANHHLTSDQRLRTPSSGMCERYWCASSVRMWNSTPRVRVRYRYRAITTALLAYRTRCLLNPPRANPSPASLIVRFTMEGNASIYPKTVSIPMAGGLHYHFLSLSRHTELHSGHSRKSDCAFYTTVRLGLWAGMHFNGTGPSAAAILSVPVSADLRRGSVWQKVGHTASPFLCACVLR